MKKILIFLSAITLANCSDSYDDSKLWDSVNGLENRVAKLEELCKQMNTNISSLQEIVTALQKNESIKSVATLPDGSGYLMTFSSGKTITIYHGKNGVDGEDGKDGENGKDAITPVISVKKDADGIYYWTVNNDWLLVDGKKVKAEGTDGADGVDGKPGIDGEDGSNGKDGITPQFKIEDGYWYISYDNEQSWTKLGKATGDSGLNGTDGDNFFKGVSIEDGYVCFTLNDKDSTVIKLPFVSDSELTIEVKEPGTLKSLLTDEQKRSIIQLKIQGNINDEDIRVIRNQMLVLEILDLAGTNIMSLPSNSFCYNGHSYGKHTLKKVVLPDTCVKIGDYAFYGCINLEEVYAPSVTYIGAYTFYYCSDIQQLTINGACENSTYACFNSPITSLIISDFTTRLSGLSWCNTYNVYLPNSITSAAGGSFSSLLQTVTFDKDYKCDYLPAFNGTQIEKIEIPKSVKFLSSIAHMPNFANCSHLATVIIPENSPIRYFPEQAFSSCPNLQTFICNVVIPPMMGNVVNQPSNTIFRDTPISTCTLYVPKESLSAYNTAPGWKDFGKILPIEE